MGSEVDGAVVDRFVGAEGFDKGARGGGTGCDDVGSVGLGDLGSVDERKNEVGGLRRSYLDRCGACPAAPAVLLVRFSSETRTDSSRGYSQ